MNTGFVARQIHLHPAFSSRSRAASARNSVPDRHPVTAYGADRGRLM
jgi:hypothetical protein